MNIHHVIREPISVHAMGYESTAKLTGTEMELPRESGLLVLFSHTAAYFQFLSKESLRGDIME